MLFIAATFAALLAQTTPAAPTSSTAAPNAAGPSTTPAAAAPDDPSQKKVCRDVQNDGSRTTHQECHTQAEWDQMSQDANDMAAPSH